MPKLLKKNLQEIPLKMWISTKIPEEFKDFLSNVWKKYINLQSATKVMTMDKINLPTNLDNQQKVDKNKTKE